jgi:hypothetical protein
MPSQQTLEHQDTLDSDLRLHLLQQAAATGRVPQPRDLAAALGRFESEIHDALVRLAAAKILILAPNDGRIWAAAPFCAEPSSFRVKSHDITYSAICIWDALGIAAALHQDAEISTVCGDCGEPMTLEVRNDALVPGQGVIHFGVPARRWWDNIGYT